MLLEPACRGDGRSRNLPAVRARSSSSSTMRPTRSSCEALTGEKTPLTTKEVTPPDSSCRTAARTSASFNGAISAPPSYS